MPKIYDTAPDIVAAQAQALIDQFHPDLNEAQVKIDYIFAFNETGHAITLHGKPCLGLCKIINLKDRSKGMGDVEIQLDGAAWKSMTEDQRNALLDHELEHVIVVRNDDGDIKTDDLNRPKIRMKKHDYDFGWFECIARRHGINSPEVTQAKLLWDESGQAFFPMLTEV